MYTPDQVKEMFAWAEKNPGRWVAVMQSVVLDLVESHQTTRRGAVMLAKEGRDFRTFFEQLRAQFGDTGEAAGPGASANGAEAPTPTVGADGSPLDPAQAEAERMMNAAAGPRPGEGPVRAAPPQVRRPGPGVRRPPMAPPAPSPGGTRAGADGTPVDSAQEEAERMMDEAAGPRPA